MKKFILLFAFVILLFTSCDRMFVLSGRVVAENTGKGIPYAGIITSEADSIKTDSLGNYYVNHFGPGSQSDKVELLISKKGYETKYVDLGKGHGFTDLVHKLKPSTQQFTPKLPSSLVKGFYIYNKYISNIIALFTLLFILIKRIRYKWLWVLAILFINATLKVNYIDGGLSLDFFHSPFYIKQHVFYPFTIKIPLLLSMVAFWLTYFLKREWIINKPKTNELEETTE